MGEQLICEISIATGLPEDLISTELVRLVQAAGISPASATLEDLRKILAEYVQDILLEVKDSLTAER